MKERRGPASRASQRKSSCVAHLGSGIFQARRLLEIPRVGARRREPATEEASAGRSAAGTPAAGTTADADALAMLPATLSLSSFTAAAVMLARLRFDPTEDIVDASMHAASHAEIGPQKIDREIEWDFSLKTRREPVGNIHYVFVRAV